MNVLFFGKKTRISTNDRAECVKKSKKTYEVWGIHEKRRKRERETFKSQIKEFE